MRLSRRILLQMVGPTALDPADFVLIDEVTARELAIPAGEIARLRAVLAGFLADAPPDGLDVLALDPASGSPAYRSEHRPIPTGRSIELPYATADRLDQALNAFFRPYWDGDDAEPTTTAP